MENLTSVSKVKKGDVITYHSQVSILNGVDYQVKRIGKINVTLEPLYSPKLIGLPMYRQPFNINLNDLNQAIEANIYTIK